MRELVFDSESTGLSFHQDRFVSVAFVELIDREPTGSFMHFYLNPEQPSHPKALEVHGLTEEFLADKPKFSDVASSLLDYISNAPLIIHNAPFDSAFLRYELFRCGRILPGKAWNSERNCAEPGPLTNRTVCTLAMARSRYGRTGNKLDDLVERFGIENLRARTGKHGALVDALLLVNVLRCLSGLPVVQLPLEKYFHGETINELGPAVRPAEQAVDQPESALARGAGDGAVVHGSDPSHHADAAGAAESNRSAA